MEQKYFISYAAYGNLGSFDLLNTIIYINEEITQELISSIEDSIVKKLNKNTQNNPYFAVQIINFIKL